MEILIFLAVLTALLVAIDRTGNPDAGFFALISGIILIVALVILPIYRTGVHGEIAQFNSIKESLASSDGEIESTAIRLKAVEANAWLADRKYWNDTLLEIYIPDEIMALEPIQLGKKP